MFDTHRKILTRPMPLLLGAGAAAIAAGIALAGQAGAAGASGAALSCEIAASPAGGSIVLKPLVHAAGPVNGSFRFKVVSAGGAGSTNIRQGGGFSAAPGKPAALGQVMLGGGGQVYEASLELTADGRTVTCAETIGGAT